MENIKQWYNNTYPTDDLGEDINPEATFEKLTAKLSKVYEYLHVYDSLVRERVFLQLAEIAKVDYSYIYDKWLNETV